MYNEFMYNILYSNVKVFAGGEDAMAVEVERETKLTKKNCISAAADNGKYHCLNLTTTVTTVIIVMA